MGFLVDASIQLDTIYEQFQPQTTVQKQHFIEWFSGKQLPSYWFKSNITNTGTFSMKDAVDGGFSIASPATSGSRQALGFNNIRQYSHNSSVCITIFRRVVEADADSYSGFKFDDTNSTFLDTSVVSQASYAGDIGLYTGDASAATNAQSDIDADTDFHVFKIENGSSNIKLTIDGVLKITKTTNRPTQKMQPYVLNSANASAVKETEIRYFEAYNV